MANLKDLERSENIVNLLSEKQLMEISAKVTRGFEIDEESCSANKEMLKKAVKIAQQVTEHKTHPFPDASNVKFPLITKAAVDFASRVYPEIIQGGRVVKAKTVGEDVDFQKQERATRVSKHMSYQLLEENVEWEDSLDKLLHILPIFGTVFKKVYYHPILDRNVSELVIPDRLVVNQNINSLDSARRITHIIEMHANDIIERQRVGLYADVDIEQFHSMPHEDEYVGDDTAAMFEDMDAPLTLLEQHCYLDLDDDGYQEPYIVVLHKDSGTVLRIVSRFNKIIRSKGQVKRIDPEQFFVDYHFIKSPDGGFYSIGIGKLLLPLNESINTLINQLIDSGTLNNQQSGFIGRGLRIRNGSISLKQGEWQVLDTATGADIKNNIVPVPSKEPSGALFNLLGLLIDTAKDLSSVTDVLSGKQPAQNVPATTILTLAEQGLKVFNSITKRFYRSLKKEFRRLFELNSEFLSDEDYQRVLDDPIADVEMDYDLKLLDVIPVADPAMASDAQRLSRARAILELPTVNPIIATRLFLQALQVDDEQIESLIPVPDPNAPPAPEEQKTMAEAEKLQAETQEILTKMRLDVERLAMDNMQTQSQVQEAEARIKKMLADGEVNIRKMDIVANKSLVETELKSRDQLTKEAKTNIDAESKAIGLAIEAEKVENGRKES